MTIYKDSRHSPARAVTAAGSAQGNATAIQGNDWALEIRPLFVVSAADGTKGVVLPDVGVTFTLMLLIYNDADAALKVWPASGETINGLGANNPATIAARSLGTFVVVGATAWGAQYTNAG